MYRWGGCVVTITVCLFTEPAVLVVHDWGRAKNTLTAGTWIICWMGSSFTPKNRCMCSKPTTFTTQKLGRVQGNILWIFKTQCGSDRWAKCWCDKKAELTHLRVSNVEIRTCSHVCRERGPDAWRKQINFRVEKPCPLYTGWHLDIYDLSLSYRILRNTRLDVTVCIYSTKIVAIFRRSEVTMYVQQRLREIEGRALIESGVALR